MGLLPVSAARAVDSWTIQLGIRETGDAGPIGSDGGTSGPIEWVTSTSPTLTAADGWKQFTWNFGSDAVTGFTGNGVLDAPGNKGVLEHIRIVNSGGNVAGELRLRIDDIVNTVGGVPTTITGFEGFPTNTANNTLMFREPLFSNSTSANMSTGPNGTLVSTATAHGGAQSLAARWTFVPNGNTSQWLRLTTNNAPILPDPVIDVSAGNSVSMWLNMQVYNPTGTRVRGIDVSSNQGSLIDWNRVAQPMSAGGAGMSFAIVRATRGGTSGTSSTGAMRVDDTEYAYNIAGAKAAGLLTGPYHFARPDMWTPNDAVGLGNAPGSVGTPEDEARHYLQVAGSVMKPGFLRPVYDLEDGNEETNNTQLTNFVLRFNDTITKYKGPSAKILVYSGTTYANAVNEEISQFPLWMPRYQVESDWAAGDVFTGEGSYGVWGDSDPLNPLPWSFWQYYSPDVYIPGVNAGTHNDIDVAHGDINFVRQFLVQGAIWEGSSNAQWTTDANWDTGVAPTGSTEVLLDTVVPPTGSNITLTAGRSAGGVYFAGTYTLSGGSLTLTDGRIDVDATKTGTIATDLSAPNGFRKVGEGTMTHASGTTTVTGTAQVLQGTMNVPGGSIAVSGDLLVNPELTQRDKSLVAPTPVSASEITSSTLTINGGTVSAAAAYVGGNATESGAIGTLNVSAGSLTVAGALKLWDSSVPLVDSKVNLSGGTLNVGLLDLRDGLGLARQGFNFTGGTLNLTNSGYAISNGSFLNTTDTSNLFAVTLTSTHTLITSQNGRVGVNDGSALTWTQTGGVNQVGGFLRVGGDSGTTAYNVSGGTVSAANIYVGGSDTAGAGAGSLNLSGTAAVTTPGILKVWNTGSAAPGGTRLSLAGGTLSIGGLDTTGNPARFSWTGGTLEYTNSNPTIGTGAALGTAVTLSAGKTLRVKTDTSVLHVLPSGALNFTGGKLDLTTKKLITSAPLGTWNGSAYTNTAGQVDAGRGNASNAQWNGAGIVTTDTRAVNNNDLVSIGTANIGVLKNIADTATTTFAGQTVLGSDTIAMVTWGGDANLDGKINIDDYGQIDFNSTIPGSSGWFNGDFNYDGKINIDDYGIIDFNVTAQNLVFPTAGDAGGLSGVAAVPEPSAFGVLAGAALLGLRRRRRAAC